MKVVINECFGGFGVSDEGYKLYAQLKGLTLYQKEGMSFIDYYTIPIEEFEKLEKECETVQEKNELYEKYNLYLTHEHRTDPVLIEVVQQLGDKANGFYSKLKIVEIPDDVKWEIHDYDGIESIHEVHRVWG